MSQAQVPVGTPAAVHTLGAPGYIFGAHTPSPLHGVTLTGQDWACVCCLGMCLAEAGPIGPRLGWIPEKTKEREDVRPERALSERKRVMALPRPCNDKEGDKEWEPGSKFWFLWGASN